MTLLLFLIPAVAGLGVYAGYQAGQRDAYGLILARWTR